MADRSAAVRSVSSSTLFAEIDVGIATTYAAAGDAAVTKARPRIAVSRVFMPPSSLSSTALLLLMRRRGRPTFRRGGGWRQPSTISLCPGRRLRRHLGTAALVQRLHGEPHRREEEDQ